MNITAEGYGHAVMLLLKGELTEDSLGAFIKAVDHQLEDRDVIDVVLNMEEVPFADSAALEYLLGLQERLAGERLGQVKFVRPDENIRKILELTRLESTFEVHEDASRAIQAMQV